MKRRDFVKITSAGGASLVLSTNRKLSVKEDKISTLQINPKPVFELSPWLYMQFMEPLGVTDSSVEAAWDHLNDKWREDVVQVTQDLAPGMIRWGGLLSAYYRWREGVGPRNKRKPMLNLVWNGVETNQIGTAEFVDFCRQVGADPLMCVNFESEGFPGWAKNKKGEIRSGDSREAAQWVDYCNNPDNKERKSHGINNPIPINVWQIGNETSYSKERFDIEKAALKTVEFARAMKKIDPSIKIIGWGDSGWATRMSEIAGEYIDYIAFHNMFDPGKDKNNSILRDNDYRKDPAATWEVLMNGYKIHEKKISAIRNELSSFNKPLALTECHYALPGRNRCEVLSSWAAGVSYARMMNLHERNGDQLKIATLADFCGTRWQVNAVMIPVPGGNAFMMPVAKIMRLYRKKSGKEFLTSNCSNTDLDTTASRSGNKIYLHIVNTNRMTPAKIMLKVSGMVIDSGTAFELSADPEFEILSGTDDPLIPIERILAVNDAVIIPPASVTAIELIVKQ